MCLRVHAWQSSAVRVFLLVSAVQVSFQVCVKTHAYVPSCKFKLRPAMQNDTLNMKLLQMQMVLIAHALGSRDRLVRELQMGVPAYISHHICAIATATAGRGEEETTG